MYDYKTTVKNVWGIAIAVLSGEFMYLIQILKKIKGSKSI